MKCPLLEIASAVDKKGKNDCMEEGCAWWVKPVCAIFVIANALNNLSEFGIAIDKREE